MPDSSGDRAADASIFVAGVQVLDRGGSFTGPVDVSVLDGRVAGVGRGLRPARDQRRLDGHGLWLLPASSTATCTPGWLASTSWS